MIDPLLERQLRRSGLSTDVLPTRSDDWASLLDRISRAYEQFQQDRYLLERSLDISSREMQQLYDDVRSASATEVSGERDKLRAIIDGFRDGFCTLDARGRMLTINPAGAAILEDHQADDADGSLLGRFAIARNRTTPDGTDPAELMATVMAGGSVRDERAELTTVDGRTLPVSVLLYPIVQNGRVTGCALTFRDLSAFQRTESSRRRLAMAVEASADAICITDPEGVIEYVNPAFVATTGWQPQDAIGQRPNILKSGYTAPEEYRILWHTITSGNVWSGRLRNRRRGDDPRTYYWAQTTIAPIRDPEDRLVGFVAVQRDVTAEVEAEERRVHEVYAAEVRARVAQLLLGERDLEDRLGAAVYTLAALPELRFDGRALIATRGQDDVPEILLRIGDPPGDLVLEDLLDPPTGLAPVHDTGPGGLILPIPHGGGVLGSLWLGTSAGAKLSQPEEDVLRLLAGMTGIAIVDDRARREANRARQAALDAVEAKARFLANMSHEIRTPMNGVLGMLEMLGHTPMTNRQREYLDTAHGSAEMLLTVINDILDYSKIEAGKLDLEHIPFDLRLTVEEMTTLFNARARTDALELVCFIPVDTPTRVIGDPTRLRQVLGNVLGNAIKFTTRGEVVLRVSVEDADQDRVRLRFEIEDTGIGMTPDQVSSLFQPFVQADGSTTRRFGGTGLGLAICKQLVELMGGEIGATSTPGAGSRFWFRIPFETQSVGNTPSASDTLAQTRIIAVDDNTTNLTILAHYLTSWGVEHACTEDPNEALGRMREAARSGKGFQIALVDMQMPRLDGLALGRMIKKDPLLADTRLLLLSSLGQRERDLKDAGFLYALSKPIRQNALRDVLLRMRDGEPMQMRRSAGPIQPVVADPADAHDRRSPLHGRVLLAEDNLINQRVAVGMLSRLGLGVQVAANGAEALERAAAAGYDLVLMDCEMPVMDGFEATRALREREQRRGTRRLPIVALTANAMAGDREKCIAVGMDDYIPKPIKLEQLSKTLARWLQPANTVVTVSPPPPAELVIDREQLLALRKATADADAFAAFLDQAEDRLSDLVERVAEDAEGSSADTMRLAARRLRSSAAQLGAMTLSDLGHRLEALGRDGRIDQARRMIAPLRAELVRSLAALAALRV